MTLFTVRSCKRLGLCRHTTELELTLYFPSLLENGNTDTGIHSGQGIVKEYDVPLLLRLKKRGPAKTMLEPCLS